MTTATLAGATYGFTLCWALLFSLIATIVLQEMSARLGLATGRGLGEALRTTFRKRFSRAAVVALVIAAIVVGNAAFQSGNLAGAAMGLELLTGAPRGFSTIVMGLAAGAILLLGRYRIVESVLIGLVALMSIVFVACAVSARPSVSELLSGSLLPRIPSGSLLHIVALIGTTVVPYNLFLHASAVARKWGGKKGDFVALRHIRFDTLLAVTLGGVISLSILCAAAMTMSDGSASVAALAAPLERLLGPIGRWLFGAGIAAAGLTSAVTAPLAAAYATAGLLARPMPENGTGFRLIWLLVLVSGILFALIGGSPIQIIVLAQAANGILLPVIAVFLLIAMNDRRQLGAMVNRRAANLAGLMIVAVTAGLGGVKLWQALGQILEYACVTLPAA